MLREVLPGGRRAAECRGPVEDLLRQSVFPECVLAVADRLTVLDRALNRLPVTDPSYGYDTKYHLYHGLTGSRCIFNTLSAILHCLRSLAAALIATPLSAPCSFSTRVHTVGIGTVVQFDRITGPTTVTYARNLPSLYFGEPVRQGLSWRTLEL